MRFDDEELEIALLALRYTRQRAEFQCTGNTTVGDQAVSAARCCTMHCIAKMTALIGRIEQYQKDAIEEKEDGDTP